MYCSWFKSWCINVFLAIILRLKDQKYKNGGTALFSCQATGKPVPSIDWYFNGTRVDTTNSLKYFLSSPLSMNLTTSTLIIFNVTWSDVGEYTCLATNVVDRVTSSGQLLMDSKCTDVLYWLFVGIKLNSFNSDYIFSVQFYAVSGTA